jgi:hypothetical protein
MEADASEKAKKGADRIAAKLLGIDCKHVRFIRLWRLCVMLGRYRKKELRFKESQ